MSGIERPDRAEHSEHGDRPLSAAERIARYEERLQADPATRAKLDPFERLGREEIQRLYRPGEAGDAPREQRASGWDAPDIADHPERPEPERIHLTEERRTHILDGDPDGPAGGHRHGTGKSDKTEFPERWDDDTAIGYIVDVARDPDDEPIRQPNGRWRVHGIRDEVDTTVIALPDGRIWTAWPEPGGRDVVRNPPEEGEPT
jgi:hypothetical protein